MSNKSYCYSYCSVESYCFSDCLHLQLYRDSKDRFKQSQTKASLSLQHFLGVETGFTLDKESNTIAIICQDLTVVLAFDTRERLIQWHVKIASNLGEHQQFLVLVSQVPSRAKISTGPARLHVQEMKFCMTSGVPPRLIGFWEIGHLRRYGVIEGRFCFEGGSRCGRGEGLYVLVTDQGAEIRRTMQMAAQGRLSLRRRPAVRKSSAIESPRKILEYRRETSPSDRSTENLHHDHVDGKGHRNPLEARQGGSPYWSTEFRSTDLDSNYGCGDATSVHGQIDGCAWSRQDRKCVPNPLERCMSCISKFGVSSLSRSSTANTSTLFNPAWTMEPVTGCTHQSIAWCAASDRISLSSHCTESSENSECSVPAHHNVISSDTNQGPNCPPLPPKSNSTSTMSLLAASTHVTPCRPPKPVKTDSLTRHTTKKTPMPFPSEVSCPYKQKPRMCSPGLCSNYDVPKNIFKAMCEKNAQLDTSDHPSVSPVPTDYYDTPKNLKEILRSDTIGNYPNYDKLPSVTQDAQNSCACIPTSEVVQTDESETKANGHQVIQCCENWSMLPCCRMGQSVDNIMSHFHKVKLSGHGKMPLANVDVRASLYATIDKHKKGSKQLTQTDQFEIKTNYENVAPENSYKKNDVTNYENIEFTQSLEYYENAKILLQKTGLRQSNMETRDMRKESDSVSNIANKCNACTRMLHSDCDGKKQFPMNGPRKLQHQEDYLLMETRQENKLNLKNTNFQSYLPMRPGIKKEVTNNVLFDGEYSTLKSVSLSNLPKCSRKQFDTNAPNFRSSTAALSPSKNSNVSGLLRSDEEYKQMSRKRSSSADSSRYLEECGEGKESKNRYASLPRNTAFTDLVTSNSLTSLTHNKSPCKRRMEETVKALGDVTDEELCERTVVENVTDNGDDLSSSGSMHTLVHESLPECTSNGSISVTCIKRSSSVPCKSGNNRDSSGSNDSGVSIDSLRQRIGDFTDFEVFRKTARGTRTTRRYEEAAGILCFHASLPRRSKSSDPPRESTFHHQIPKVTEISSSAEAQVPLSRNKKGYFRSTEVVIPNIDSRSTSSGTSDMSDYLETLSLYSHSSSDAPDSLSRTSKMGVTTLRPRSGNEYQKIDRSILQGEPKKGNKGHFADVESTPEKSDPSSSGYMRSCQGQEVQCADL
ncbi:hypothetical protein RUM43_014753 [Polyplax serrata]|uniref:IRS-type PTB domain-containing protein n=1 Tax=Polyplax serrata TaxID=468196 RepID=A0AAN8PFV8_POLSC